MIELAIPWPTTPHPNPVTPYCPACSQTNQHIVEQTVAIDSSFQHDHRREVEYSSYYSYFI
jgi:ribosomal protein L44E